MNLIHRTVQHNKFFYSGDSQELYNKNLRTMPPDWIWRTKQVRYNVNSQAYRAPEWSSVNWNESVLLIGCSFPFGVGIDESDTCSVRLASLIKKPVINLGVVGSSPLVSWINSTIIAYNKFTPAGVIYIWPPAHRIAELHRNQHVTQYGPWNSDKWGGDWITHKTQGVEMLRYFVYNTSALWQCPVLHYHLDHDMCNQIPELKLLHLVENDYARDWTGTTAHPGPKTHQQWAGIIANHLNGLW